ncbi:hypothetical protein G9A89_023082 [Geosiphon pyriformis]|nr:hypothetical protein G9A89_023082 [Geosiphon pyriformis]
MAYVPITKLEKFTSEENNVQVWLNNMKKAITAIQADYFTTSQILNQFIRGLCSSIFQYICPMHPVDLQATITSARDFEAAKLKANYA